MSSMIYLSSDSPIPEILNPHERSFSINEALDMGMEVPEHLLTSGIDPDWKNAIHWSDRDIHFDLDHGTVDDGGFNDDFAIIPILPGHEDVHSSKKYQARVECIWTVGRATQILSLIGQLLEDTDEVEFWHIYMDNGARPGIVRYDASMASFTPEDLMEISSLPTYDCGTIHHCVTIRK